MNWVWLINSVRTMNKGIAVGGMLVVLKDQDTMSNLSFLKYKSYKIFMSKLCAGVNGYLVVSFVCRVWVHVVFVCESWGGKTVISLAFLKDVYRMQMLHIHKTKTKKHTLCSIHARVNARETCSAAWRWQHLGLQVLYVTLCASIIMFFATLYSNTL